MVLLSDKVAIVTGGVEALERASRLNLQMKAALSPLLMFSCISYPGNTFTLPVYDL